MSSESLFVALQLYGVVLIVLSILFFRSRGKSEGKYNWKKFLGIVVLDVVIWLGILLVGGLIFKGERQFLVYFLVVVLAKGIAFSLLKPISPKYMNYLYFSPPFVSGAVWGAMVSRD
jgi:hypothetical protein